MEKDVMLQGIGVTSGIAIGTAFVLHPAEMGSIPTNCEDAERDIARLKQALEDGRGQLAGIMRHVPEETAAILQSHINFLEDPTFNSEAFELIRTFGYSAERAVQEKSQELEEVFLAFDDAYMQERAGDARDVGTRILNNLLGVEENPLLHLPAGSIVFANDLAPSQTAQMDKQHVVGFVTQTGGRTSHSAIMAKAMQIAAVVGCGPLLQLVQTGDEVVVNAVSGEVFIRPSGKMLEYYTTLKKDHDAYLNMVGKVKFEHLFRGGNTPVLVAANIGTPAEAQMAKENGADGIGLFRTEFLYMDREDMPSEEEQFEAYRQVAELFGSAPVIIRTLDIGGDKALPYLAMETEANPFLGVRAIRLCMQNEELFYTQLRALLRASHYGNLKIMFPMVGSLGELRAAKTMLERCKQALDALGQPYNPAVAVGMMVEVPSTAVLADDFAKEVDFFSIGTNDLTQYTLAIDRGNPALNHLYDSMHPAVLALIRNTVQAAKRHGIFCGMCGEMASDSQAIPILAEYGLDEFSVGLGMIGQTKCTLLAQPGITGRGTAGP